MVYIDELTANELKELIEAENWDNKDKTAHLFIAWSWFGNWELYFEVAVFLGDELFEWFFY